jgi:hypothetical protein
MPAPYTIDDLQRARELHALRSQGTVWDQGAVKVRARFEDTPLVLNDEERNAFLEEAQLERLAREKP